MGNGTVLKESGDLTCIQVAAREHREAARRSVQHPYVNRNSIVLEYVEDFESIFGRSAYCYVTMGGLVWRLSRYEKMHDNTQSLYTVVCEYTISSTATELPSALYKDGFGCPGKPL